jgi:hypothetical protein
LHKGDENMNATSPSPVAREILELHEFFVDWFTGACAKSDAEFDRRFTSHFDPAFHIVLPGGLMLPGAALGEGLKQAHGSNPAFRIRIRDLRERAVPGTEVVIATYEEWQKHALNSEPVNNARLSSATLRLAPNAPNGVLWLHLHESWLPPGRLSADAFDF